MRLSGSGCMHSFVDELTIAFHIRIYRHLRKQAFFVLSFSVMMMIIPLVLLILFVQYAR